MKHKFILIITFILILILAIGGGYVVYKNGNKKDNLPEQTNKEQVSTKKIIFNTTEKNINLDDYNKIKSILDKLTYRVETIDAKVTDYLEIDGKKYSIQFDSKGLTLDYKQSNISKEDFDLLFNLISQWENLSYKD